VQKQIWPISLLILFSCGKEKFPDYSGHVAAPIFEVAEGHYKIQFIPLNASRSRPSGLVWIKGNQFFAKILMKRSQAATIHRQYIHSGNRCPRKEDDLNRDGMIDYNEVILASGGVIIPLDSKLNSRISGLGWSPEADKKGSYFYSRSGNVTTMLLDLYKGSSEGFEGLEKNDSLRIPNRTLIIYGRNKNPRYPVACGRMNLSRP
jgi:hypothetical protein